MNMIYVGEINKQDVIMDLYFTKIQPESFFYQFLRLSVLIMEL